MLVAMMMLAVAAPNPRNLDPPRIAYQACLKKFEIASVAAKMDPAAFAAALKSMCTAEAASLSKALTNYDVAMGTKRGAAEATAASDVADYLLTTEERFRARVTPASQAN